jgi:hypothetical protein
MGLPDSRVKVCTSTHHLVNLGRWCEVITYSIEVQDSRRFKGMQNCHLGRGERLCLCPITNHMWEGDQSYLNPRQLMFRDWVWCRGSFRDYECGGGEGRLQTKLRGGVVTEDPGFPRAGLFWLLSSSSISSDSSLFLIPWPPPPHWQSGLDVFREVIWPHETFITDGTGEAFLSGEGGGDDVGVRRVKVFTKEPVTEKLAFPVCHPTKSRRIFYLSIDFRHLWGQEPVKSILMFTEA